MPRRYTFRRYVKTIRVYDSKTGKDLPEHTIYAVTYEPKWQALHARISFESGASTSKSLAMLEAYMTSATNNEELRRRVFRVRNLLNAVPLGVRTSNGLLTVSLEAEMMIEPYRDQVEKRSIAVGRPKEWDWNESRKQLKVVYGDNPKAFEKAFRRLTNRAMRKNAKAELVYYIAMIEEVIFDTSY